MLVILKLLDIFIVINVIFRDVNTVKYVTVLVVIILVVYV